MSESQNIEYKTIWKDEYLKWICGFANAQGVAFPFILQSVIRHLHIQNYKIYF